MKNLISYLKESLDVQESKTIVNIKDIEKFLKTYYEILGTYTIDQEKGSYVVNVKGNIYFDDRARGASLTDGTFRFGKVDGSFICKKCKDLKTLEGAPEECEWFNCSDCYNLKTLEGAPRIVTKFSCIRCDSLKNLEGAPEECSDFSCSWCNGLESLEGAPKKCFEHFECNGCPNLKTLKGAPQECGSFNCSECPKLKDLIGMPRKIEYLFNCESCPGLKGQKLPHPIKGKISGRGSGIKKK